MSVVASMNNASVWLYDFAAATFRFAGASFVAVFAVGTLVWTVKPVITMFMGKPSPKPIIPPRDELQPIPLDDD